MVQCCHCTCYHHISRNGSVLSLHVLSSCVEKCFSVVIAPAIILCREMLQCCHCTCYHLVSRNASVLLHVLSSCVEKCFSVAIARANVLCRETVGAKFVIRKYQRRCYWWSSSTFATHRGLSWIILPFQFDWKSTGGEIIQFLVMVETLFFSTVTPFILC